MGLFDMFRRQEAVPKADRLFTEDEAGTPRPEDDEPETFEKEAPEDRGENGPFDEAEAEELTGPYIDFGALRIPAREGLALRVELLEQTRRVIAVALDYGDSTLQVQAFAAPRSTGVWRDVRGKLAQTVAQQGGKAEELDTELGIALHTWLPQVVAPQAAPVLRGAFFYGVDGPRWFLRGVVSGRATVEEAQLAQMLELFRGVVVVRGSKAAPPRDLLELTVPKAMAAHMAQQAAAAGAQGPA